jgi:hypothetical protein
MARANDPPKSIGELIDKIDNIREELLAIQQSMEKMERAPSTESGDNNKKP